MSLSMSLYLLHILHTTKYLVQFSSCLFHFFSVSNYYIIIVIIIVLSLLSCKVTFNKNFLISYAQTNRSCVCILLREMPQKFDHYIFVFRLNYIMIMKKVKKYLPANQTWHTENSTQRSGLAYIRIGLENLVMPAGAF